MQSITKISTPPNLPLQRGGIRIFSLLLTLLTTYHLSLTTASAEFNSKFAGTSSAAFLKIGAGARPTAMGEAYTGVADDVNAIYWNTAGLSTLKKSEFIAMRAQLYQGLEYNFFAFAHPTKRFGTLAIGLNNLNISEIEERSADTDKPDTTSSSNDSAYTLAYSFRVPVRVNDGFHLGLGMKYIRQTLLGDTANSFAVDLGSLYRFGESPLSLGLAVQNIGSKPTFKKEDDDLPLTMKVGASYLLGGPSNKSKLNENGIKGGVLLALDLNVPRDNDPSIRLGTELTRRFGTNMALSLRGAGYQAVNNPQYEELGIGLSAGFGFTYKFFSFDFAWMPFRNLGNTYRYSVRLRF